MFLRKTRNNLRFSVTVLCRTDYFLVNVKATLRGCSKLAICLLIGFSFSWEGDEAAKLVDVNFEFGD